MSSTNSKKDEYEIPKLADIVYQYWDWRMNAFPEKREISGNLHKQYLQVFGSYDTKKTRWAMEYQFPYNFNWLRMYLGNLLKDHVKNSPIKHLNLNDHFKDIFTLSIKDIYLKQRRKDNLGRDREKNIEKIDGLWQNEKWEELFQLIHLTSSNSNDFKTENYLVNYWLGELSMEDPLYCLFLPKKYHKMVKLSQIFQAILEDEPKFPKKYIDTFIDRFPLRSNLIRSGNRFGMLQYIKENMKLDPFALNDWLDLGSMFCMSKDWEKAKKCYRIALAIDQYHPFVWAGLVYMTNHRRYDLPLWLYDEKPDNHQILAQVKQTFLSNLREKSNNTLNTLKTAFDQTVKLMKNLLIKHQNDNSNGDFLNKITTKELDRICFLTFNVWESRGYITFPLPEISVSNLYIGEEKAFFLDLESDSTMQKKKIPRIIKVLPLDHPEIKKLLRILETRTNISIEEMEQTYFIDPTIIGEFITNMKEYTKEFQVNEHEICRILGTPSQNTLYPRDSSYNPPLPIIFQENEFLKNAPPVLQVRMTQNNFSLPKQKTAEEIFRDNITMQKIAELNYPNCPVCSAILPHNTPIHYFWTECTVCRHYWIHAKGQVFMAEDFIDPWHIFTFPYIREFPENYQNYYRENHDLENQNIQHFKKYGTTKQPIYETYIHWNNVINQALSEQDFELAIFAIVRAIRDFGWEVKYWKDMKKMFYALGYELPAFRIQALIQSVLWYHGEDKHLSLDDFSDKLGEHIKFDSEWRKWDLKKLKTNKSAILEILIKHNIKFQRKNRAKHYYDKLIKVSPKDVRDFDFE